VQATLDAVDLLTGAGENAAQTLARLARLATSILCFAAGCAVSALLYWLVGFWCLAVAVVVGTAAALVRIQD